MSTPRLPLHAARAAHNLRAALAAVLVAAAAALASPSAEAGRSCEDRPLDAASARRALELAERAAHVLDTHDARVVVLARAGQDLSKHRLRYSHLGLAYRDEIRAADGTARAAWRVVHKLNECGSARGELYRQGLGEFFLDRMHRFEAGLVILAPQVQAALEPLLRDNARSARWHEPRYSMVAYPWAQTYQQSNQWAIETLAGAVESAATTRRQAQAWLQLRGYEPTVLRLNAFTRLGARVGTAHIAFDDHPNAKRFADRIETVTVDSVFDWLERSNLGARAIHVR